MMNLPNHTFDFSQEDKFFREEFYTLKAINFRDSILLFAAQMAGQIACYQVNTTERANEIAKETAILVDKQFTV